MSDSPKQNPTPTVCFNPEEAKNIGLRGITVADSAICKVDGEHGVLLYRGYDIETLAVNATYEEVAHLLLCDKLPTPTELASFRKELASSSFLPSTIIKVLKNIDPGTDAMVVLQGVAPLLSVDDAESQNPTKEANYRAGVRLVARLPLLVAAWYRVRQGKTLVAADPELTIAENFLLTMHDQKPDPFMVKVMDVALILHAEHSFNASTFTCRLVASTRATIYAAVAAAIGSLSGELHGGANARVHEMLEAVGHEDKVEEYVGKTLDGGGKIMGMGHAVYKTLDPRAKILGPLSQQLGERSGDPGWHQLSEKIMAVTKAEFKQRKNLDINANVDFFSASLYRYMGIPVDLYTPIFAMARISGWVSHYLEEFFAEVAPKGALYRPRADYAGRYCGPEGCLWQGIEERAQEVDQ